MSNEAERVWRARKNHAWIDAQVRASDRGTELRFFYDGDLIFSRSWPTRDAAIAYAARQLGDLQRAGWNTHW